MNVMERLTAALADRYRIERELGAGGMATVFLAHDLKHERDVAIKVLHPDLGAALGGERFLSEIRTTAKLQHPHILPLLDSGAADGLLFYVMPYVAGETLRSRLERERQLPLDDAIQIAREIADALGAAHALGIVHRDIKPENILLQGRHAVVADFGIALAVQQAGGQRLTQTGLSLGTPAYMSPEQAMGERAVDARTDIYALGAVTYEMLTGEPPFTGATAQAIVAKVMTERPQRLSAVRDTVPAQIEAAVNKALAKLPADRWNSAANFSEALAQSSVTSASADAARESRNHGAVGVAPRPAALRWFGYGAAAALIVALGAWAALGRASGELNALAYRVTVPSPAAAGVPVVSPDGRYLLYSTGIGLLLRALDEDQAVRIEGTEGVREPFWSPDSEWIAFFSAGQLKKVPVAGGPQQTLTAVPEGRTTGSWSVNGTMLVEITENPENEGWFLLAPGASSLTKIKELTRDRIRTPEKAFPSFLPDGEHFLFTQPVNDVATLMVGSIGSEETRALAPSDSRGVYASGFILYVRQGTLFAQSFDAATRTTSGEPMRLLDDIDFFSPMGRAAFSVSQTGLLISRRRAPPSQLRWVDRDGRQTGTILQAESQRNARLAADNKRLVVSINDTRLSTSDIWIAELDRNVATRLTSAPRAEMQPRLSPDGTRVVFAADWEGPPNLYLADIDGGEPRVLVPFDRTEQNVGGWTPDGRQVVYTKRNDTYGMDLWVVDVATGAREPILATPFEEDAPAVSPNGRWLAYTSNASGRTELYVREFPKSTWQIRVSLEGGTDPVWRDDGQELFYYQPDGVIMAVPIASGAVGRPSAGVPSRLFGVDPRAYRSFDAAAGGTRFLMNLVDPENVSRPDDVAINWPLLLRQR
jgi:serine/threonine-protein kinase